LFNQQLINLSIEELITSYAHDNFANIRETFQNDYPDADYQEYVDYILTNETNAYDPKKSYSYFQTIILKQYMENINNDNPLLVSKLIWEM